MIDSLITKLFAIDDSLTKAGLRHAFGGAIALAYCVAEPRGTRDLDVNIFISADRARDAVAALPAGVDAPEASIKQILRDGQTRLTWGDVPVDLFLNNLPVHDEVAAEIRWVPLRDREIPVLSCESLVLFKSFFSRTKDWADIEAICEVDPAILARAADRVEALVGQDAAFTQRLRRVAAGGPAF